MYFSNVAHRPMHHTGQIHHAANMRGTAAPMWSGGRMMSGQMRGAGPMMMAGQMRGTGPMMMAWTGQTQSLGRAASPSTYANPQRGIHTSPMMLHRGTSTVPVSHNNLQQANAAAAYRRQSNIPGYW